MDLSSVSIMIKTFLRDPYLFEAIAGIRETMPEIRMIVVDDGEPNHHKSIFYGQLVAAGHVVVEMPFDSGFGAKSNAAIALAQERPYLLIGSDDFDFRPRSVRVGIERLVTVLDGYPYAAIASGRVNGNRYEGWLHEEDNGRRIREEYIKYDAPQQVNGVTYHTCELTVNYSLILSSILGFGAQQVHWDDDVKIGGGEHGAFFVDVKRAGYGVVWVPGAEIKEQSGKPTDIRYQTYRGRAGKPGRPCFAKRGIAEYVMFGGGIERP